MFNSPPLILDLEKVSGPSASCQADSIPSNLGNDLMLVILTKSNLKQSAVF